MTGCRYREPDFLMSSAGESRIPPPGGVSVPFSMGTVLLSLPNFHILRHFSWRLKPIFAQMTFPRTNRPDLRTPTSPHVSTIVGVLAFLAALSDLCRLWQATDRDYLAHVFHGLSNFTP